MIGWQAGEGAVGRGNRPRRMHDRLHGGITSDCRKQCSATQGAAGMTVVDNATAYSGLRIAGWFAPAGHLGQLSVCASRAL